MCTNTNENTNTNANANSNTNTNTSTNKHADVNTDETGHAFFLPTRERRLTAG